MTNRTAYFSLRRYEDAARTYEQGLKLDAKDWHLWEGLGAARYWIPLQRAQSPEAYRQAISLAEGEFLATITSSAIWQLIKRCWEKGGRRWLT